MTSINVQRYNMRYGKGEDTVLETGLPICSTIIEIESGPPISRIADNFTMTVPPALSGILSLFSTYGITKGDWTIANRLPIEMRLRGNKAVGIFVTSLDLRPDVNRYSQCLRYPLKDVFATTSVALRGWMVDLDNEKKKINKLVPRECIVYYDGERHKGALGLVAEEQSTPKTQVIIGAESLGAILRGHFSEGFVSVTSPDGGTCWGRFYSIDSGTCRMTVDALQTEEGTWKFDSARCPESLSVFMMGSSFWLGDNPVEILGDVILCNDGTILHSYYFSRDEWIKKRPQDDPLQKWKDGYIGERFYPPGSKLVPQEVIDSFNRDMPEWFRQKLLEKTAI